VRKCTADRGDTLPQTKVHVTQMAAAMASPEGQKSRRRDQVEVWVGEHSQELAAYLRRTDVQSMRRLIPSSFELLQKSVGARRPVRWVKPSHRIPSLVAHLNRPERTKAPIGG
jgi:hypothetical protein